MWVLYLEQAHQFIRGEAASANARMQRGFAIFLNVLSLTNAEGEGRGHGGSEQTNLLVDADFQYIFAGSKQ